MLSDATLHTTLDWPLFNRLVRWPERAKLPPPQLGRFIRETLFHTTPRTSCHMLTWSMQRLASMTCLSHISRVLCSPSSETMTPIRKRLTALTVFQGLSASNSARITTMWQGSGRTTAGLTNPRLTKLPLTTQHTRSGINMVSGSSPLTQIFVEMDACVHHVI